MIEKLQGLQFKIELRTIRKELSQAFIQRYPNLPADYLAFLQEYTLICNKDETSWFNGIEDFNEENDTAFRWNEFEMMGIEEFEDDEDEKEAIRNFWDTHLPIALSVKGGYQYLCIDLSADNFGRIYYGAEPEFEDSAEYVCENLGELFDLMTNGEKDDILWSFK
ncbi:SMI1/KNR4 family protein [Bacteroides cellulosilyticus]|uniref:SMI1/KNR4 family protein n=1 Tax=Bacteroides cellulosilyticus TaxID=246787 RepID=UPI0032EE6141